MISMKVKEHIEYLESENKQDCYNVTTNKRRISMNKDYELKEKNNNVDNKLKQLYEDLLKDFGLSHDDHYVQIKPSLFAINETIFRDENN